MSLPVIAESTKGGGVFFFYLSLLLNLTLKDLCEVALLESHNGQRKPD